MTKVGQLKSWISAGDTMSINMGVREAIFGSNTTNHTLKNSFVIFQAPVEIRKRLPKQVINRDNYCFLLQ